MIGREALRAALMQYRAADENEEAHRMDMMRFLEEDAAHYLRSHLAGHFTASALVLDEGRESVLLLHHRKLARWLQPGGHADGDQNLERVARKEVEEETGIGDLRLLNTGIFDVDVHLIPERKGIPEHFHHDVRFLFQAPSGAIPIGNHEVNVVQWVGLDAVGELAADESVQRMVRKAKLYK